METKKCTQCQIENPLTEFYGKIKSSWCKKCHNKYAVEKRKQNPEKYKKYVKDTWDQPNMIFARKKANAKSEKIYFYLTKVQFIDWYKKQQLKCHYCGLPPKDFKNTKEGHLLRKINLGIDRVDNSIGYKLNNIVLCCNMCNSIKGGFFSYEEMKFIGETFVKQRWKERGILLD